MCLYEEVERDRYKRRKILNLDFSVLRFRRIQCCDVFNFGISHSSGRQCASQCREKYKVRPDAAI